MRSTYGSATNTFAATGHPTSGLSTAYPGTPGTAGTVGGYYSQAVQDAIQAFSTELHVLTSLVSQYPSVASAVQYSLTLSL